jgi:predicted permease
MARNVLVISELALAMMLLAGTGLLLRSFSLLQRVDPGFATERVLTFDVRLPDFTAENAIFFSSTLERLRQLPGVRSVAVVSQLPVTGRGIGAWLNIFERPLPPSTTPPGEAYRVVSPGYFPTMGIPLRRGRHLTDDDQRERNPSVVINDALAKKYWPGGDPIGKEIYLGAPDNFLFPRATIVGIVGNTKDLGLDADPLPAVYVPLNLMPYWGGFSYVVRATADPLSLAAAVRREIHAVNSTLAIRNMRTMDDVLRESMAPARWSMLLLAGFALVALVMAALGVFGVLSFVVSQRTKELGIRIALGADPGRVRGMVVGQGLGLAAAGLALGLAGALALTRFMSSMLFGIKPTDPITYVAVSVILLAIAALASYLPARRATRVDPLVALRAE